MNNETDKNALPAWLADILPEPRPPYTLSYEDEQYVVTPPSIGGESVEHRLFDDIEDAYNYAKQTDQANPDSGGLIFSSSLPELEEEEKDQKASFIFLNFEKGFGRMLLASTDESYLDTLISAYETWGRTYDVYVEEPDNFLKSYNFISDHPCFWVKSKNPLNDYSWEFSGHAQNLWFIPYVDEKDGKVYFMMEAGSHVAPYYTEHYHDLRLDTYADSYENVIIKTAELVHKFFHKDGTERKNVEYEKSEIEEILEQRMAEINSTLND